MIAAIPKHAPRGIWEIYTPNRLKEVSFVSSTPIKTEKPDHAITTKHLDGRLKESLLLFSAHVSEWVQPVIASEAENTDNPPPVTKISTSDITENPRNIIINAPPQYGLTCLAHHLASQAWTQKSDFWLYLDARAIKPNKDSIDRNIQKELESASRSYQDIKCVILDSWSPTEKDGKKLLNKIYEHFENIPVICMQQTTSTMFYKAEEKPLIRESENLHLWSLPRESIRKIVAAYNDKTPVGDESSVTSKIISDMEVLNLHRTPLNCLTLLKVSEIDFDESPVNRTEIIKRVLFILFNIDDVATYKLRPDLKDCEHVLGYFCEQLIREGSYGFSRHRFLSDVQEHSKSQLMDLETQVVFDVLFENNIIVMQGEIFYFRFSYWLFYFAAQRMHHSKNFAEYILTDMRYAQHPELIEFYTGIDRRREDALTTITRDLRKIRALVKENCGLPDDLNPYRLGKWNSSEETKRKMQQEVANGVAESNLPEIIKDRYADENYDRRKPYNQAVNGILSDHSFVRLVQASRALRNSDYACIHMKRELLSEIVHCWEQASRIIFITLPILTENGSATYDGVHIVLIGDGATGDTPHERFTNILTMIPSSVARNFSDDLFSMKMGPLLFDKIQSDSISELSRHELILLLIIKRPRGWQKEVGKYIASIQHNSFYLFDIHNNLRAQYRYCFAPAKTLADIEYLIKLVATKHANGVSKTPSAKLIEKMSKLNPTMIPERCQPPE